MKLPLPLTLALSPSDGAREHRTQRWVSPSMMSRIRALASLSFSPSEEEKAGMRGSLDCIETS